MKIDKKVEEYILVRDTLRSLDVEIEELKKPWLEIKNKLEGEIMAFLEETGSSSVRTPLGTCPTTTRYTASLVDAEVFMKYVVDNHKFYLLDRRANATAVKDYVKENNALPPGVNLNAICSVGVRRATATGEDNG